MIGTKVLKSIHVEDLKAAPRADYHRDLINLLWRRPSQYACHPALRAGYGCAKCFPHANTIPTSTPLASLANLDLLHRCSNA